MKTPYEILDVLIDANDDQIKSAYLQKVKECPPDRDQVHFQEIHNAYSSIKDSKSRTSFALFTLPIANFEHLIDQVLITEQQSDLPDSKQFLQLLSASIDDDIYSHAITYLK